MATTAVPLDPLQQRRRLYAYSLLVGVIAGLGAAFFVWLLGQSQHLFLGLLAHYHPPGVPSEGGSLVQHIGRYGLWLIPLATTLGGLITGWLVFGFAPEAEGHGTDAVIAAYHQRGGNMRARVPLIKTIASAITIGSGGSGGREGPIAQIGAGFGSILGNLLRLESRERRILVMAGAGAGIGAVFHAPLGGALIGAEVLYRDLDFESSLFVPAILASVVAYSVNGYLTGFGTLFQTSNLFFHGPVNLPLYLVLALICVGAARLFVWLFYWVTRQSRKLRIPQMLKPAAGGLLVGLIGLALPQSIGGGYGWLQIALLGGLPIGILVLAALGKIVTTSLTIGPGGSGGVFGPSVIIGALLGGAVGKLFQLLFPGLPVIPSNFALVGMAAFFSAAAKTPLSSMVLVSEMTGGYGLLVPLMLASFTAYLLSGRQANSTLYSSQVASQADSPVHRNRYLRVALEQLRGGRTEPVPSDLQMPDLGDLLRLGRPVPVDPSGHEFFYQVTLPEHFQKTTIAQGSLPGGMVITSITRGDKTLIPRGDSALQPGDQLVVVATPETYRELERWLSKGAEPAPT